MFMSKRRTKLTELLEQKDLSDSEMMANLRVFRIAGRLIKSHAKRIYGLNKKGREFRRQLFKGLLNWQDHSISPSDYDKIMAAHALEGVMLCAHAKQIITHASRWYFATREHTSAEICDYFQDTCMALIDALFGYAGIKKAEFTTYMWTVLRNRMITFVSKYGTIGKLSIDAHLLIGKIESAQTGEGTLLTAYDLAARLNVSVDEIKVVQATMVAMTPESQIKGSTGQCGGSDTDGNRLGDDYSAWGRPVLVGQFTVWASNRNKQDREFDPLMKEAIKTCPMSPFERDILIAYSMPYWGWQAEVAGKHTNPQTGRKYSRRAPAVVLPLLCQRVRNHYYLLSKAS